MSKQPPFQSNHSPHHSKYTPEQSTENYENERSAFQHHPGPFQHNNDPYFPNIPFSPQNTQGVVASHHLAYPHTASSSSQWPPPIMPNAISAGYPSNGRLDVMAPSPTAGGSHSPRQRPVIAIPPCQTGSFKVKASRDNNVDHPEAEVILEEKRQRNTAASARFRVRKKERNQHLEQTVSHLSTRAEELEREASDLRRENTWLKEIVIMKGRQNLTASGSTSTSTSASSTSGPSGQRRGGDSKDTSSITSKTRTRSKNDSGSSGKGSDSEK